MTEHKSDSTPVGEPAAGVGSEPAQPESISPPPSAGAGKPWLKIVAVIVVILLVAVAAYAVVVGMGAKGLAAAVDPDTVTVDAGLRVTLTATVQWGKDDVSTDTNTRYRWSISDSALGAFDVIAQRAVKFTAARVGGEGTITCNVTYTKDGTEHVVSVIVPLTVNDPVLDSVIVAPSTKTVTPGQAQEFKATTINSVGDILSGLTVSWSVTGMVAGDYTLSSTTGAAVTFIPLVAGTATLTAQTSYEGVSKSGIASVLATTDLPERTVDYYWYDMFNVPFNEWWYVRANIGKEDLPWSTEYPYIFKWFGSLEGNVWYYTMVRLNITGSNMPELNMNERPEFLPTLGIARGGTAEIDWRMQYLTNEDMAKYPANTAAWADGWVVGLSGTVSLDKTAAMTVINVTSTGWDNFEVWWDLNGNDVGNKFSSWMTREAGKFRLDIFNMYEYPLTILTWNLNATKVGDRVELQYDLVTWGMEALMTRWLREAFMPTEWYFEDMTFRATIGPERANLDIDTAVNYAMYAYEDTLNGDPVWCWESLRQDYVASTPAHPRSDFDPYSAQIYENFGPGSWWYGEWMSYDYTPGVWNLSEGETLTLTWPSGDLLFLKHVPGDVPRNNTVANVTGPMVVKYAEPMETDIPGQVDMDEVERYIRYTGPIDMWTWSKEQTAHELLMTEWQRMGVAPYGLPFVEFRIGGDPVLTKLGVVQLSDEVVMNEPAQFELRALDQYNEVVPDYVGTVTFYSNDTGAALPADYTFTAGDAGVYPFEATFSASGVFNLTVWQVDDPMLRGEVSIDVVSEPSRAAYLTIGDLPVQVFAGTPFSMRVTCYNQFDVKFVGYRGTVTFESDDAGAILPPPYTFKASDAGSHLFVNNVTFSTSGQWYLLVTDLADPANLTVQVDLTVFPAPGTKQITHTIYDMFQEPWGGWWYKRWATYGTDIVVGEEPGMSTMLYLPSRSGYEYQGVFMAPYRYAIDGRSLTGLDADVPTFMPSLEYIENPVGYAPPAGAGGPVPGVQATVEIYFEYLTEDWWNGWWVPTWTDHRNFGPLLYRAILDDGWYVGTIYNVTMNRAAAEQWLGLPQAEADPIAWWGLGDGSNNVTYLWFWEDWLDYEANTRIDIYNAYEFPYSNLWTGMKLRVNPVTGNIEVKIGHMSWGYEALITKWLAEARVTGHQPWFEDFKLTASYTRGSTDLTMDTVCQYSLTAVKANLTADGAAWAWQPTRIDYAAIAGHPSDWAPYSSLYFQSWNAGDTFFGQNVPYDATPQWMNLSVGEKLIIEMPKDRTVPGFLGVGLTNRDYTIIVSSWGNYTQGTGPREFDAIWNISRNGTAGLAPGFMVTNYPDNTVVPTYSAAANTLTFVGPIAFDNFRHSPDGPLYHSAPWIEMNVAGVTAMSVPEPGTQAAAGTASATSEAMVLAVVVAAAVAAVVLLGAARRRQH